MTKYNPPLLHERIYSESGVLKFIDLASPYPYSHVGTDVRFLKLDKTKIKLKLVWENGLKVSEIVKKYNADYGINFPFFTPYNGGTLPVADCKIGNTILNQGYDTLNGAQQTKWHGFSYKNGIPSIGSFNINDDYGTDGFLAKTTPLLINNGNPVWDWYRLPSQEGTAADIGVDTNGNYVRCQRTVLGIDGNGDLLACVGDGRTPYDRGMNLEEMSLYMQSKGAMFALNGDGGSSSVIANLSGSLGQNSGSAERIVNHAILIYLQEDDPKVEGLNYLIQNYGVSPTTKPSDPVDMGTLGLILKKMNHV